MWHFTKLIPTILGVSLLLWGLKPDWSALSVWQTCFFFIGQTCLACACAFHVFDRVDLQIKLNNLTDKHHQLQTTLTTLQESFNQLPTPPTLQFSRHHHRRHSSTPAASYVVHTPRERPEHIV